MEIILIFRPHSIRVYSTQQISFHFNFQPNKSHHFSTDMQIDDVCTIIYRCNITVDSSDIIHTFGIYNTWCVLRFDTITNPKKEKWNKSLLSDYWQNQNLS